MPVTRACGLVGVARSTFYRITRAYQHYTPVTDPVPHADRVQPATLSDRERQEIRAVLFDDRFAELSVCQTYWRAFDLGLLSCSQRTFYRIATAERMVGDRRRGKHSGTPSRRTPRVGASEPGQLWSWDVTDLKGPDRRYRYKLMLAIDVFSRYPVAWRVEASENKHAAVQMFHDAFTRYGPPKVLHADNGAPMRSQLLLDLLEASQTTASFSRPRVSDDNPFSESLFKTIKYDLACPERFDSLTHARDWTARFLARYATDHCHSGMGWYTPEAVFTGQAAQQQARRQARLDAVYRRHPHRFRRPPRAPEIPTSVGINTRKKTNEHLSQTG